jgi:hypothetical protein
MKVVRLSVGLVLILALAGPAAQAQSVYAEDWEWNLTPYYMWLPTMSGNAVVMGTPAPIEIAAGDVIDDLGFVFDFHLEGSKKANGFWLDVTFLNLQPTEETPGGTVETDMDITLAESFGFRRFTGAGARTAVDMTYGLRYWNIEPEVTIPGQPKVSGDQDWVDGTLGLRLLTNLDNKEKWLFTLRGDVGGGGSSFTWSASTLFVRRFGKRYALLLGYRALDVDYSDGAGSTLFVFDVKMEGVLAGFDIQWPKR